MLPRCQRGGLVGRHDDRRLGGLRQSVLHQVGPAAVDDRLEQLPTGFGARQDVVAGLHSAEELGVRRRRHVGHVKVQRLFRTTAAS